MATNKKSSGVRKRKTTKKQATGLYQTSTNQGTHNYRPRYYSVSDTPVSVTQYDRLEQIRLARSLYTTCPDLGGALIQKSQWVAGPGSWNPIYYGENEKWGKEATKFLTEQFFPSCNVLGQNYNFTTTLFLSSLSLDVDGDTGLVFSTTSNGFPQIMLIPGHRIGQRDMAKTVASGKFKDYRIVDGVIINDLGRPIGYRILGDKPEKDKDISVFNFQLLIEPEWQDQFRGISRVARSINDWQDKDDIDDYLKRQVKLAASVGLIHSNETGDATPSGFTPGTIEDVNDPLAPGNSGVQHSAINGGEIYFLKAAANEKIETLKNENPSPNTEDFINRIQKRALYSCGWPSELLDPSKIGGASVRLIQDLVRKTVLSRQSTIERRAKAIVNFAIATAMQNKLISNNENDWYQFKFTRGSQLVVDNGNEAKSDGNDYKLGINTLSNIVSKRGDDWVSIRKQNEIETKDLIERAQSLSTSTGRPYEECLTLLQQQSPKQVPVNTPTNNNTEEESE